MRNPKLAHILVLICSSRRAEKDAVMYLNYTIYGSFSNCGAGISRF